jgi:hypothetical protein
MSADPWEDLVIGRPDPAPVVIDEILRVSGMLAPALVTFNLDIPELALYVIEPQPWTDWRRVLLAHELLRPVIEQGIADGRLHAEIVDRLPRMPSAR